MIYRNGLHTWDVCKEMLKSPHILIAGTTGSGKSVLLNSIIYTALAGRCTMMFIDLKRVELAKYKKIVNCWGFITDPSEVVQALDGAIETMEDRYRRMEAIEETHTAEDPLFIVIDELADLVTDKAVLERLVKIGRLGRAAEVRLICASQDPSRRTLCAQLMQNFTCCVALRCKSSIESRQITGYPGAETLPLYGKGYMWDARGIRLIDIPMTDEKILNQRISERKASNPSPSIPSAKGKTRSLEERIDGWWDEYEKQFAPSHTLLDLLDAIL